MRSLEWNRILIFGNKEEINGLSMAERQVVAAVDSDQGTCILVSFFDVISGFEGK